MGGVQNQVVTATPVGRNIATRKSGLIIGGGATAAATTITQARSGSVTNYAAHQSRRVSRPSTPLLNGVSTNVVPGVTTTAANILTASPNTTRTRIAGTTGSIVIGASGIHGTPQVRASGILSTPQVRASGLISTPQVRASGLITNPNISTTTINGGARQVIGATTTGTILPSVTTTSPVIGAPLSPVGVGVTQVTTQGGLRSSLIQESSLHESQAEMMIRESAKRSSKTPSLIAGSRRDRTVFTHKIPQPTTTVNVPVIGTPVSNLAPLNASRSRSRSASIHKVTGGTPVTVTPQVGTPTIGLASLVQKAGGVTVSPGGATRPILTVGGMRSTHHGVVIDPSNKIATGMIYNPARPSYELKGSKVLTETTGTGFSATKSIRGTTTFGGRTTSTTTGTLVGGTTGLIGASRIAGTPTHIIGGQTTTISPGVSTIAPAVNTSSLSPGVTRIGGNTTQIIGGATTTTISPGVTTLTGTTIGPVTTTAGGVTTTTAMAATSSTTGHTATSTTISNGVTKLAGGQAVVGTRPLLSGNIFAGTGIDAFRKTGVYTPSKRITNVGQGTKIVG